MTEKPKSDFANYRGKAGAMYHEAKHGGGGVVDEIVAKSRVKKFQPFVRDSDSVFEYGVGTGYNLMLLSCQEKVGYDVAETCRSKVEDKGIRFISSLDQAVTSGEGGSKRFDVVICHHVLEHVPNPRNELLTIRHLLKPSGRLILCVPLEKGRRFRKYSPNDPDMHLFSWNTRTICNLLFSSSYKICEAKIRPFGYERSLAPLASNCGFWVYKGGLRLARLLRPVSDEIFCVAIPDHEERESEGHTKNNI